MGEGARQRPLRVAIVLDRFLPSLGGERYFSFLTEKLAKRGHEVHVFATEVEAASGLPYKVHIVKGGKSSRAGRILALWRLDPEEVAGGRFDVVHGVAQCRASTVLNPHGGVERAYLRQEFASIESPAYRAYRRIRRYLSPRHYLDTGLQARLYAEGRVRRVIAISQMVKRDIVEYYGFPADRIDVVFNTVDLDRFHPKNTQMHRTLTRGGLGIGGEAVLLLFAGNNFRLKGLPTLLKALSLLVRRLPGSDLRLLVAGRGRPGRYRSLLARLGITDRVIFGGALPSLEHVYGASDIYVHPTFYDSCSLTVLEALASGLPVVTTRFNGAADAITSPDGGTVIDDPADAQALADAIAYYLPPRGARQRGRSPVHGWRRTRRCGTWKRRKAPITRPLRNSGDASGRAIRA